MGITYEDIERANKTIKTTDIKGKEYADVAQRIKAFRMVYPTGYIHTHFFSIENGVCTMLAEVGYYTEDGKKIELGTGTAQEKESSSFINKTSYIENCETSATGRALGMAGFGIDVSVASADEVQNAIANQSDDERKATPKQVEFLKSKYTGANLEKLLTANNITKIEDISMTKASEIIGKLRGGN
ncbi:MAG: hypothetical protein J6U74_01990 [Clostridia bacterium]|nr:hypothetical protein [Clostridia bacterium]